MGGKFLLTISLIVVSGCQTLPDPHRFVAKVEAIEKGTVENRMKRRQAIATCFVQWRNDLSPAGHIWAALGVLVGIGKEIDDAEHGALAFTPYYLGRKAAMRRYVNFCLASNG